MEDKPPLILITNDDGIESPGLAATAAALDPLGDLLIVAPHIQQSGAGRSMPLHLRGRLFQTVVRSKDVTWAAYSAEASPAQAVQHALLELADRRPALAVSGINYGENLGVSVTISGTVGAALEAAAHGIPALAISLQTDPSLHVNFNDSVDFGPAMHFTRLFAELMLKLDPIFDVDVLKIDIPTSAIAQTEWKITRLERRPYYIPVPPARRELGDEGRIGYRMVEHHEPTDGDTDVAALLGGVVSVTPLSLDMTSRLDPKELHRLLEKGL